MGATKPRRSRSRSWQPERFLIIYAIYVLIFFPREFLNVYSGSVLDLVYVAIPQQIIMMVISVGFETMVRKHFRRRAGAILKSMTKMEHGDCDGMLGGREPYPCVKKQCIFTCKNAY